MPYQRIKFYQTGSFAVGNRLLGPAGGAPVEAAPTGKRVLVVGAGPSGLSAAYHLTRAGGHADDGFGAAARARIRDRLALPRQRVRLPGMNDRPRFVKAVDERSR